MAVPRQQNIEKWEIVKEDVIKEGTQARLDALQEELKKEKDTERKRRIKDEILSIKREFNRSKQFWEVMLKKPAELKGSLDSISAADLMRLDKEVSKDKRGEFLSKSFLYKRTTDNEGNIMEEPVEQNNIKEWDTLFVDFGKNKSANMRIWLWQMLGVDVEFVEVEGKVGRRSIVNGRVGYYTKPSPDWYIPVFTGTTVSIPSASKIGVFMTWKDAIPTQNTNQKESDSANDIYIERLEQLPETSNVELSVNMRIAFDFFKKNSDGKLTDFQIAWILANIWQESKFNPRANNDNKTFWIFQWKQDRINKIMEWTKPNSIDIKTATLEQQLEAAWWEITQDPYEKKVYPLLMATKTASEAAWVFVREFERPGDIELEMQNRWKMAENIDNQFRFVNNPELASIAEWPANKAIIWTALEAESKWDKLWAGDCTIWVDNVYKKSIWKGIYSVKTYYNSMESIDKWTGWWGKPADKLTTDTIKPWMHVVVDKPWDNGEYNMWKTHSFIALSTPINGLIDVVSYPGNAPPKIEKYDLYGDWRVQKNGKVLRIQWV